jgi:hypothetical protein
MTEATTGRPVGAKKPSVARRFLIATLAAALLLVGVAGYVRIGWDRMDRECSSEAAVPDGASGDSVELSWSWLPPGFTCTWGEESITKLWW